MVLKELVRPGLGQRLHLASQQAWTRRPASCTAARCLLVVLLGCKPLDCVHIGHCIDEMWLNTGAQEVQCTAVEIKGSWRGWVGAEAGHHMMRRFTTAMLLCVR